MLYGNNKFRDVLMNKGDASKKSGGKINAKACLDLFNAVPLEESEERSGKPEILKYSGVAILPSALPYKKEIYDWVEQTRLSGRELNSSFHKSWKKIREEDKETLVEEQILHYFSTYGLEALGLGSDSIVYLPLEDLDLPVEGLNLFAIGAISYETIKQRCLNLLNGMAMQQATIEKAVELLMALGFSISDPEEVSNKEAQVILIDKLGLKPDREDTLFRYLFYKATGSTLVINNKESYELIKQSGYELPGLGEKQMRILAQGFNRRKNLWLSFKQANSKNARKVNRISKLSKKGFHSPMKPTVLGNVTNQQFDDDVLQKAATSSSQFQLVKALNAINTYIANPSDRFYRVRNGKGWVNSKSRSLTPSQLSQNKKPIIEHIARKLGYGSQYSIYCPDYIDYAVPTSEKQFSGNIPLGTKITTNPQDSFLLIGVHWFNEEDGGRVDLDLAANQENGKVGWDGAFRKDDAEIMFSGDMTTAPRPDGASEWIYCHDLTVPYNITLNAYTGQFNHPFTLTVAYGHKPEQNSNYIVNPNNIIFSSQLYMSQRMVDLGLLLPRENGTVDFYIVNQGSGSNRSSSVGETQDIIRRNMIATFENMLRFKELPLNFTQNPKKADIDLSPNIISKDDLLRVLT